jgi:hypothetical protein
MRHQLDYLDRRAVVALVCRSRAVLEQQALVTAIVGLAHRGVDADVSGNAREHGMGDAARSEGEVQIGGIETALARLVEDELVGFGLELSPNIPSRFTSHQDAATRAWIARATAVSTA